jgi:hypothetical protein
LVRVFVGIPSLLSFHSSHLSSLFCLPSSTLLLHSHLTCSSPFILPSFLHILAPFISKSSSLSDLPSNGYALPPLPAAPSKSHRCASISGKRPTTTVRQSAPAEQWQRAHRRPGGRAHAVRAHCPTCVHSAVVRGVGAQANTAYAHVRARSWAYLVRFKRRTHAAPHAPPPLIPLLQFRRRCVFSPPAAFAIGSTSLSYATYTYLSHEYKISVPSLTFFSVESVTILERLLHIRTAETIQISYRM